MLLLSSADFLKKKKKNLFQNILSDHHQSVKLFHPNQDQHSVGPDFGPNCLQRLSADDRSPLAR